MVTQGKCRMSPAALFGTSVAEPVTQNSHPQSARAIRHLTRPSHTALGCSAGTYIYLPNLVTVPYSSSLVTSKQQMGVGGQKCPSFCHSPPHYHHLLPCLGEICWLEHKDKPAVPESPKSSHPTCDTEPYGVCPTH